MDTSRVTSETVDLLSRITGQKLSQRDITPQVLFLASLVTVLMGVIFVDGTVEEEEKQSLLNILYRFSMPETGMRQLTNLIIKRVKNNQTYKKIHDLLTLTATLSESERLLLIGFGYEMSAADGEIDLREKQYLEIVAKNLGVKSQHLPIFEIAFTLICIINIAGLSVRLRALKPVKTPVLCIDRSKAVIPALFYYVCLLFRNVPYCFGNVLLAIN